MRRGKKAAIYSWVVLICTDSFVLMPLATHESVLQPCRDRRDASLATLLPPATQAVCEALSCSLSKAASSGR